MLGFVTPTSLLMITAKKLIAEEQVLDSADVHEMICKIPTLSSDSTDTIILKSRHKFVLESYSPHLVETEVLHKGGKKQSQLFLLEKKLHLVLHPYHAFPETD